MGRSLGSVNKKKASKNSNKDKIQEFNKACEMVAKESSPEAVPEPVQEPVQEDKAGPILIKGKRSTRLMYEVLSWARHAKYNELAVTE